MLVSPTAAFVYAAAWMLVALASFIATGAVGRRATRANG